MEAEEGVVTYRPSNAPPLPLYRVATPAGNQVSYQRLDLKAVIKLVSAGYNLRVTTKTP